jgi:hypothetical protein
MAQPDAQAALAAEQAKMRAMHKAKTYSPKELLAQRDKVRAAQAAVARA